MDEKFSKGEQQRTDVEGLPRTGRPSEAESESITIHQVLRDDHKRIKGIFRQMEAVDLRAREMKQDVVNTLFNELTWHSRLEQEFYYPQLNAFLDEEGRGRVVECTAEHQDIDAVIAELKRMDIDDSVFDTKIEDMIRTMELHFEREERDLIPLAEKVLDHEKQLDLAREYLSKRRDLETAEFGDDSSKKSAA